jgi:hypothetical protein
MLEATDRKDKREYFKIHYFNFLALRSLLAGSKVFLFWFKILCNFLLLDTIGFRYFFKITPIESLIIPRRAIPHKKVLIFQAGEQ